MATNYDIDYNDQRFKDVEADKKVALNEVDTTYGDMIGKADKYYQDQIKATEDWADKQTELQNKQTDFAIQKIEQQREQAKKDYTKEQSGAYVDWQKQSNQYGANAEQVAAGGMTNTGFAESSQVSMYNTYQNRVAMARESMVKANLEFDNGIKEAQLQNSSILAEIHYNALQKKLELSLQGFQYKNQLILEKTNKKLELDNTYYARYQNVLQQINHENALAEEIRQYNETLAEQKRQHSAEIAYKNAALAEEKRQFDILHPPVVEKKIAKSGNTSISPAKKKQIDKLVEDKADQVYSGSKKPSDNTYKQAAAKLRAAGATTGDGGLMTRSEWTRRKNSGSKRAETSYATYDDYVNSFSAWRIQNPEK